jgi:hypothetical protein
MPSLVRVVVDRARDLPIMDSSMQGDASTDAFVEVRLGDEAKRTNTFRKSLNPVWNEDFIFEVIDDSSLQDAPLELKVVDQDLYSSELIGSAYIDLNPLIMRTINDGDKNLNIKGWFPLFDTVHGLRGAVRVTIKLQVCACGCIRMGVSVALSLCVSVSPCLRDSHQLPPSTTTTTCSSLATRTPSRTRRRECSSSQAPPWRPSSSSSETC